jgi:hypothetical protein
MTRVRLWTTKLNLSPPFFSAQGPGVITPSVHAVWSICCPPTFLPPLPCLVLAQAVGSTVCSIAVPAGVYLAWRANKLLAVRLSLQLLRILWHVYSKRSALHVRTRPRVVLHEKQRHLLVDAVVFRDGCFRGHCGRSCGGRVHVLDEIGVVGLIRP